MPVWPEQYVSALKGWPALVELPVASFGSQYRPLGFYGPARREFTLGFGATEKGKLPSRILEAADDNRNLVLTTRRTRIREHEFDASEHVYRAGRKHVTPLFRGLFQ